MRIGTYSQNPETYHTFIGCMMNRASRPLGVHLLANPVAASAELTDPGRVLLTHASSR